MFWRIGEAGGEMAEAAEDDVETRPLATEPSSGLQTAAARLFLTGPGEAACVASNRRGDTQVPGRGVMSCPHTYYCLQSVKIKLEANFTWSIVTDDDQDGESEPDNTAEEEEADLGVWGRLEVAGVLAGVSITVLTCGLLCCCWLARGCRGRRRPGGHTHTSHLDQPSTSLRRGRSAKRRAPEPFI